MYKVLRLETEVSRGTFWLAEVVHTCEGSISEVGAAEFLNAGQKQNK